MSLLIYLLYIINNQVKYIFGFFKHIRLINYFLSNVKPTPTDVRAFDALYGLNINHFDCISYGRRLFFCRSRLFKEWLYLHIVVTNFDKALDTCVHYSFDFSTLQQS
jgi:hypothetical protein